MKKILVTGANGQLGSEIRDLAAATGHQFVFTDVDDLDLTSEEDASNFLHAIKPDYIINCAAYTAVDNAESDEEAALRVNAGIPEILIDCASEIGSRIIHLSTDYVFSGTATEPYMESDITGPESAYGRSKLEGERIMSKYDKTMIIRTSWLYSYYGKNFVKSMFNYIQEKKELRIVNDQHGSPTYARDLAAAILEIIGEPGEQRDKFNPGIYHYANNGKVTWYQLTMEIRKYLNADNVIYPIETKDYPLPAPRPMYSVLSTEKIQDELGINIPWWKQSLIDCLDRISGKNKLNYDEE